MRNWGIDRGSEKLGKDRGGESLETDQGDERLEKQTEEASGWRTDQGSDKQ